MPYNMREMRIGYFDPREVSSRPRRTRASTAAADRSWYIQSLERGLAVIRSFSRESPALTLSQVAERTGLTRATARRFLLTLVELGYVREEDRYFSLRASVLTLGSAYLASLQIVASAEPVMKDLVDRASQVPHLSVLASHAGVLEGSKVVFVARVPVQRRFQLSTTIGSQDPAHATSLGRILLSGLSDAELDKQLLHADTRPLTPFTIATRAGVKAAVLEARERGWTVTDREMDDAVRSFAAPIRNRLGHIVAAVNISTVVGSAPLDEVVHSLVPLLLSAASQISDRYSHQS
jgi:IclR family pca regulon transcriptional regulator